MNQLNQHKLNTSVFSVRTLSILQSAGWFPERSIDIGMYIQTLKANGYEVFPVVEAFLKQFGGLRIIYSIDYRSQRITNSIHFDAAAASAAVPNEEYISNYVERIGAPVCIIGEANNESTTLMMDREGKVYGGFDMYLSLYGQTGEQAIENTITMQDLKQL